MVVFFNDNKFLISDGKKEPSASQRLGQTDFCCPHLFRSSRTVHLNMREHDLASVLALAFVNFIAVSSSIVEKCDTQVFASETRHIYLLPPDSFYMLHLLKSNCNYAAKYKLH